MNELINESINELINESINEPINESSIESINELMILGGGAHHILRSCPIGQLLGKGVSKKLSNWTTSWKGGFQEVVQLDNFSERGFPRSCPIGQLLGHGISENGVGQPWAPAPQGDPALPLGDALPTREALPPNDHSFID